MEGLIAVRFAPSHGNRRGGGVPDPLDVDRHLRPRQTEPLGGGLEDAAVRLVGHHQGEVLEGEIGFVPVYGNTLMGLAAAKPGLKDDGYSITYYAPQPRAALRVVDPDDPTREVDYDSWGRVELTTLTHEFFMPRFLERDEALRRRPTDQYAWDGVGEVRPFGQQKQKIVEGVY